MTDTPESAHPTDQPSDLDHPAEILREAGRLAEAARDRARDLVTRIRRESGVRPIPR